MTILIVTHAEDRHANLVEGHLRADGVDVVRVDTVGLCGPAALLVRVGHGDYSGYIAKVDLSKITCVWQRRPSQIDAGSELDRAELTSAVGGVLAWLPHLNHPAFMAVASHKPAQLLVAAHVGLPVPETVIATAADEARVFTESIRGRGSDVVIKMMSPVAGSYVDIAKQYAWETAVHLTQHAIHTRRFARLTVVDDNMFAAMITSPFLDWRRGLKANLCRYAVVDVPPNIAPRVREYMGRFGLRYCAFDFAIDPGDDWWFLEGNPNGQCLWIEENTGLPIGRAIATALARPAAMIRDNV